MTNPWLQLKQILPSADINLVCLPFAGGFAEYFLPWRDYLPADFQLCPVQLPGRSYRWQESAYTSVQSLLSAMTSGIETVLHEQPYVLFGHSMGGYIAYEFSKLLVKRQLPLPKLLVVSSVPAPMHWLSRKLLSQLSEKEFSDFFFRLGGFHPELLKHEKFINMQMALLRDDINLCESCGYDVPAALPFPILAMGGVDDEYVMIKSMTDWSRETTANFHLQTFSGKHFYLNEHLPAVFEFIKRWII